MARYTDLQSIEQKLIQPRVIPSCWSFMQPEFIEYIEGESLAIAFPVLDVYANPRGSMQGGFMSAAFDNTFGAMLQMETHRRDMASIDLHVNYQRPIFVGDTLVVRAYVKSIGQTLAYFYGEARDKSQNRLIATAGTNLVLVGQDKFVKRTAEGNPE